MTKEVERLLVFENECAMKDDIIEQLQEEVTNLQNFIRQIEVGCCVNCHNPLNGGTAKLLQMDRDVDARQVTCSPCC